MSTSQLTKLAEALGDAGLTQADLARHLNCSPAMVNRWVKGTTPHPRLYQPKIVRKLRAHGVEVTEAELWAT